MVGRLGKKFRGVLGAEIFHNKVFSKVIMSRLRKHTIYGQTNLIIGESIQILQLFLHLREAFQSIGLKTLKNLDTFIFV